MTLVSQFFSYQRDEANRYGAEYLRILRDLDLDDRTFAHPNELYNELRRLRKVRKQERGGRERVAPSSVARTVRTRGALANRTGAGSLFSAEGRAVRTILTLLDQYHAPELEYDAEQVNLGPVPVPTRGGYTPIGGGTESTPLEQDARNQERNATRLRLLAEIERTAYTWFDARKTNQGGGDTTAMEELLNEVQTAHRREIALLVSQEWEMQAFGGGDLTPDQQQALRRTWRTLVRGDGALRILSKTGVPVTEGGFVRQVHAAYARLLATPSGRVLLARILKNPRQHTVNIKDIPRNSILGPYGKPEPAVALSSDQEGGRSPGTGSPSVVGMVSGFTDTELRTEDQDHNAIITPAWLALGHELIHALHALEGRDTHHDENVPKGWTNREEAETIGRVTPADVRAMSNGELLDFVKALDGTPLFRLIREAINSASERLQKTLSESEALSVARAVLERELALTENQLRAEVGLTRRHGHGGVWRGAPQQGTSLSIANLDESRRHEYEQI
jgi:hypothetical protein